MFVDEGKGIGAAEDRGYALVGALSKIMGYSGIQQATVILGAMKALASKRKKFALGMEREGASSLSTTADPLGRIGLEPRSK